MGVTGLWKLVEPCGQPVPVEMLENKILAVDISIWLHQVVKGFQDNRGSALANSHLLGLFHRLCKLMYYRIKPVFVFDGKVPSLKKETIAKRNQKRNKLVNEADRIQTLLLQSLAKEKVVQQALGSKATGELLKASPSKNRNRSKDSNADIFKLPDISKNEFPATETDFNSSEASCSFETTVSTEPKYRLSETQNLQAIDVKSDNFRKLPADIRHEILLDIKETRKQSSWGKLHELPSKGNDFSVFQMKRLLKRRQVQESIEEVEKEMDGVRTFTLTELENIFSEEGIIDGSSISKTKHISSDANTRFLLINNLKETLASAASSETKKQTADMPKEEKKLDEDDLDMTIQKSLDETAVYNESDYHCTDGYKLRKEQRTQLKNAAVGLARAFMIEHAGMNNEDVQNLLERTQISSIGDEISLQENDFASLEETDDQRNQCDAESSNINDHFINEEAHLEEKLIISKSPEIQIESKEVEIISDSSSDSEFEEVKEFNNESMSPFSKPGLSKFDKKIKIFVDPSKRLSQKDDIFADCFKTTAEKPFERKTSSFNVSHILNDLKKQAAEAIKINLSDIKIDETLLEISNDSIGLNQNIENNPECDKPKYKKIVAEETQKSISNEKKSTLQLSPSQKTPHYNEVIEIVDHNSDPKPTTPSKTRDISDFFETNFIIKRIQDETEQKEVVPKMSSPFCVKKLRKRKSTDNHDDASVKVNKVLFDDGIQIKKVEHDYLDLAAKKLKKNKSTAELESIASKLVNENLNLEKELNRQHRMGMTITEKMNSECMELLRLFGIPFIVAPMEAEAQCAFLDYNNLTNGTITDDSDIWLFGGKTVYKNFFAQNKHVMEFNYETIKSTFNIDRNKMVQLALLVGSDYTTGIKGIGAVTALEILATFSPKDIADVSSSQKTSAVVACLTNFYEWWKNSKTNTVIGNTMLHRLRNKLGNIELCGEFPSFAVVEAYLKPTVDNSQDSFSWGVPDVESIKEFTRTEFGWTRNKTNEILEPIIERLNDKKWQSSITNYFPIKSISSTKKLGVSKRVQNAINCMSTDLKPCEEVTQPNRATQNKKRLIGTAACSNSEMEQKKKLAAEIWKRTNKKSKSRIKK